MAVKDEYRHCFESAAAAAGYQPGDTKAEAALADNWRQVRGRMNTYVSQGMTERDAAIRAGRELGEEATRNAAIAKRNAMLNVIKRTQITQRVAARADQLLTKPSAAQRGMAKMVKAVFGYDLKNSAIFQAIHTELSALNTPTEVGGEKYSTEAQWHGASDWWNAGVYNDLKSAGLLKAFASGKIDDDVGREVYELSKQDTTKDGNVGVTKNKEALKVAQVIRKYTITMREALNQEGADIGDYSGFILSTMHDADRIYRAGAAQWTSDMMKYLDPKTFENTDDPQKFLNGVWAALSDGIHLDDSGAPLLNKEPGFTGPGNLAKRMSQGRVLHFKDADSWLQYQKDYARGNMAERFGNMIDRSARRYALLTHWGTNPQAEFDALLRRIPENYHRAGDVETARNFTTDQQAKLKLLFGDLTGANEKPLTNIGAKMATGARAISAMAHLGSVVFTHFNVLATKPQELAMHGIPYLNGYRSALTDMFTNKYTNGQAAKLGDLLGSAEQGMRGAALASGWASDVSPGVMSRLQTKFFDLTGLTHVLHAQKTGTKRLMARDLFMTKDTPFAELDPYRQKSFQSFGITPEDWDRLRTAPTDPNADPVTEGHMLPADAMRVAGLSPREQNQLALKLNAYYTAIADNTIITPNIADRQLAKLGIGVGANPNSLAGQIGRFIAQFKQWPVAALRHGLGQQINSGRNGVPRIAGLLGLLATTTAMGYVTMALKDLTKGIIPKEPDPETLIAAMAQGGGLGIMGDFLFGQQNRFGQGIGETLLGPVAGEGLNALATMWNNIKSDNTKDLAPEALRLTLQNTPFINLFYVRSALNYLFLDSLQEAISPGYLERSNAAMQRNQGQSYIGPNAPGVGWMAPQNHLKPFGS